VRQAGVSEPTGAMRVRPDRAADRGFDRGLAPGEEMIGMGFFRDEVGLAPAPAEEPRSERAA
jgi:hypothetical protein